MIALIGTLVTVVVPTLFRSSEPPVETTDPTKAPDALSALELVDVSATKRGYETVFLDVKIRNIGNKTSVLKRAIAHVSDWELIGPCGSGAAMPVTSTYKMTFPVIPAMSKFDVSTEMNDSLKPNEATRIEIEAGLDEQDPFIDGIIFRFTLELNFDAEGAVKSNPVLISLPGEVSPPSEWEAMQKSPEWSERECGEENLKNLRRILSLPGSRSKDLQEVTDKL
ncbi:hypothetical protein ACH4U5_13190 [Streptomyces sp. NPDC020858]|uniref:hypothetical protein n=1 Tax=Streptomyces sp. NPDC020858 TaxID=3365097 RepID=UPI0037A5E3AB